MHCHGNFHVSWHLAHVNLPLAYVLVAHGCRLLHLLLGQGIFLTLSDIVVLFLGNICLFDVHHVEVDLGLPCCCSDLIVFEGTLEVRCVLDKFWTNDPILCGTWDMKVVFNLERGKGGGGGVAGAQLACA